MARPLRSNGTIMYRAGRLRGQQTAAEARLWECLRDRRLGRIKFRRQHAIGRYVVDFCSPGRKLVIELDGAGHLDQQAPDEERTAYLESQGYKVIRFWNDRVLDDIAGVRRAVEAALLRE